MTQGGPIGATNTLVIELYRQGFVYRQLGLAAAVGMIGLSIALVVTLIYLRFTQQAEKAKGNAMGAYGRSTPCACSRCSRCSPAPPSRSTGCS